jgi:hypothetical protein
MIFVNLNAAESSLGHLKYISGFTVKFHCVLTGYGAPLSLLSGSLFLGIKDTKV